MKQVIIAIAIIIGLLGFWQTDAAAAPPHAANDRYEAIDVVDGSSLQVKIGPNRIDFRDDGGTICADAGLGFVPARHRGRVTVVDTATVSTTADVECRSDQGWVSVLSDFTLTYTYDTSTGILTDSTGQSYTPA